MDIVPGSVLSHYRIVARLGAGGMGEVFLAEDTVLDRQVALKVLPAEVAQDADRRERFVREAKAASALSHPNIAHVHELGSADGVHFIVMEYVEGVPLGQWIRGTPPSGAMLDVAVQLADALDEAHRKRIVHRDIKPANVMITPRGQVKVLDFGLAKTAPPGTAAEAESAMTMTRAGVVMGTVPYMSPEQALGGEVDARTDIFSAGIVLYEMVTGHAPFSGPTQAAVFDAILHQQPAPPSDVNPTVPAELGRVILKALEKDRDLRYQTAGDLRADLKRLQRDSDPNAARASGARTLAAPMAATEPLSRPRPRPWGKVLAGAAVLLLTGVIVSRWPTARAPRPPLQIVPVTTDPGLETSPALSPDGHLIAYMSQAQTHSRPELYVKQVGLGSAVRLGEGAWPVWSPDGRQIAFVGLGEGALALYTVPALGGAVRHVAAFRRGYGEALSWSPDGQTLAVPMRGESEASGGLFLVPIDGSPARRLTTPDPGDRCDSWPAFSPDGRDVAFVRFRSFEVGDVFVVPAQGGSPRRLTQDSADVNGLAWTPDSEGLVFSSARTGVHRLWRIAARADQAVPEVIVETADEATAPSLARTGERLAYTRADTDSNIWRLSLPPAAPPERFIASTRVDHSPRYSPDGRKISFISSRGGSLETWIADADGADAAPLASVGGSYLGAASWAPDSRRVTFAASDGKGGNSEIYVMNASGGRPQNLSNHEATDRVPSFSRDGRWLYFSSTRTGRAEVWRMPEGGGPAVQVTQGGGFKTSESADGSGLFYSTLDYRLCRLALPVEASAPASGEVVATGVSSEWVVGAGGVYYVPPRRDEIRYLDLKSGQSTLVRKLDKPAYWEITLSADGRTLAWSQTDDERADIMLAEGFR